MNRGRALAIAVFLLVLVSGLHAESLSNAASVIRELEKLEPEIVRNSEELMETYIRQERNVRINGKRYFQFAVLYNVTTPVDEALAATERLVAAYAELKYFLFIPTGVRVHFVMDRSTEFEPLDGVPDLVFTDDLDRREREELRDAAERARLHLYESKMHPIEDEIGRNRFDDAITYLNALYRER